MKTVTGTSHIRNTHPELLTDESSLSGGNCQAAAWPETIADVCDYMAECREDGVTVTVSGARTGIAGGAVPMGGAVLSTEKLLGMNRIPETDILRVSAGETLNAVDRYCSGNIPGLFYPPDPTETTASVGGTIATDASGASSYRYGSTRRWINGLKVVLPGGRILQLQRGDWFFRGGSLTHPLLGKLTLPRLSRPQPPKNAAGLHIRENMDLIDLFIGSEGELGVIVEADLKLLEKPHAIATFAVFCTEGQFWRLRDELMRTELPVRELEAMAPPCLRFLENNGETPEFPPGDWVLITSVEAASEEDLDTVLETLDMLLEENGISPDNTWGGFDDRERRRLKEFRHTLPETVNRLIAAGAAKDSRIHKISTDTAVPPEKLQEYHRFMDRLLDSSGMEHVVFGHCGQGHLHANLIPGTGEELSRAQRTVELLAEKAVEMSGTVSAEHGTGRLKKNLLSLMYSCNELEQTEILKGHIRSV